MILQLIAFLAFQNYLNFGQKIACNFNYLKKQYLNLQNFPKIFFIFALLSSYKLKYILIKLPHFLGPR